MSDAEWSEVINTLLALFILGVLPIILNLMFGREWPFGSVLDPRHWFRNLRRREKSPKPPKVNEYEWHIRKNGLDKYIACRRVPRKVKSYRELITHGGNVFGWRMGSYVSSYCEFSTLEQAQRAIQNRLTVVENERKSETWEIVYTPVAREDVKSALKEMDPTELDKILKEVREFAELRDDEFDLGKR